MDVKQAAAELNGRQYRDECSKDLHLRMKAAGIVAVFGGSDDLVYFAGAANDERGAWNGGEYFFSSDGLLENECGDDCRYFERLEALATPVRAIWNDGGFSWRYETTIPHEKFVIMEDDDTYCEGIVFALENVGGTRLSSRVADIIRKGDIVFPDTIADETQAFIEKHLPKCGDVATVMAIALAINSERTRCARLVETEEELPGDPPQKVIDAMIAVGPIGNARSAVRATKQSILNRIHSGETAPPLTDGADDIRKMNRLWRDPSARERFESKFGLEPLIIGNSLEVELQHQSGRTGDYHAKFMEWALRQD